MGVLVVGAGVIGVGGGTTVGEAVAVGAEVPDGAAVVGVLVVGAGVIGVGGGTTVGAEVAEGAAVREGSGLSTANL